MMAAMTAVALCRLLSGPWRSLRWLCLPLLLLAALPLSAAPGAALHAGFARIALPGTGEARVLLLEQGTQSLALVGVERASVRRELSEAVEAAAAGLALDALVLVATGDAPGPDEATRAPLVAAVVQALHAAHAARQPCRLVEERVRTALDLRATDSHDEAPLDLPRHDLSLLRDDGAPLARLVVARAPRRAGEARLDAWPSALARALEAAEPAVGTLVLPGPGEGLAWAADGVAPAQPRSLAEVASALASERSRVALEGEPALPAPQPLAVARDEAHVPVLDPAPFAPGSLVGASSRSPRVRLPVVRVALGRLDLAFLPGDTAPATARLLADGTRRLLACRALDDTGLLLGLGDLLGAAGQQPEAWLGPEACVALQQLLDPHALPFEAVEEVLPSPQGELRLEWDLDPPPAPFEYGRRCGQASRLPPRAAPPARAEVTRAQVLAARRTAGLLDATRTRWLEDLLGWAQGGERPFDALLVQALEAPVVAQAERVSSVVALGKASSMGQALHGVRRAAAAGEAREQLLRLVPGDGSAPLLLLGVPGLVGGWAGMNAHGLSASVEVFQRVAPQQGHVPARWIARDLLAACRTLDEAVERAVGLAHSDGVRITLVDGWRLDARVVERVGADAQVRRPSEGLLVGCDPDAALACFVGACDPDVPRCDPEGPRDYPGLRAALEQAHGTLRSRTLEELLLAPQEPPLAPCFACVFEPQRLALRACLPGPLGTPAAWQSIALGAPERTGEAPAAVVPPATALAPAARRATAGFPEVDGPGEVHLARKPVGMPGVQLHDVLLASPAPSGFARNDTIRGVWYLPPEPRGALIALPAWKESNLVGQGVLALALARKGYAVLVMPGPYQVDRALEGFSSGEMTLSPDLARMRQAFVQGAADVARAAQWIVTQGIPRERVGVMGVSLGGHIAALAYGAYPEHLAAGCFLLAGGSLGTALMQPNRTTGRMREALLARGVTPEEARPLMRLIDGVTWADPARARGALVVGARADDVVPPANVRALAEAYGARLEWLEGDHYGILVQVPKTIDWVVDHLGQAFATR